MTITRAEVLHRAETVWPMGGVPYSQSTIHRPDGYRADCSGYVSACWAIPLDAPGSWGGMNTVSLVTDGWMREINPNDLRPGDAIGLCGPGTAGNDGHVQLFTGWYNTDPNDSRYWCLEQTGGRSGPHKTLHDWPAGYRAYRYRDIVDDAQGGVTMPVPAWDYGDFPPPPDQYATWRDRRYHLAVMLADLVGNEVVEHSLWDQSQSPRTQRLIRIENRLNELKAAAAADETRDAATLAAINALADVVKAGGGSVDVAAINAAIDEAAADVKAIIEQRHADEMAALNQAHAAELAGLRAELDALTAPAATPT